MLSPGLAIVGCSKGWGEAEADAALDGVGSWRNSAESSVVIGDTHTAPVWTGTEVLFWGGKGASGITTNAGARYTPATDALVAMSTVGAPSARIGHTLVWTGSVLIVWGGAVSEGGSSFNSGGVYDPAADLWSATSLVRAPAARADHSAVWTGTRMIVWGSSGSGGGSYDPVSDTWSPIATNAFEGTSGPTVWTGTRMFVWGGGPNALLMYDPVGNSWTTSASPPLSMGFNGMGLSWDGSRALVFGNNPQASAAVGGFYDPGADSWTDLPTIPGLPGLRSYHTQIWTGTHLVMWGRGNVNVAPDGARFDPATGIWEPIAGINQPVSNGRTGVWAGDRMVTQGGFLLAIWTP